MGIAIRLCTFLTFATLSTQLLAQTTRPPRQEMGFGMGPQATAEFVAGAVAGVTERADGPVEENWASIEKHFQIPQWFFEGKFGIFMHWGVYSVPAYHNEWYEKHMYAAYVDWHAQHFGPQDQFGYKDFIPKFTCEKFNADEWAELFKASGAKYVVPTAEHHDWFSLWNTKLSRWNAVQMGPKRDLIGDLAIAVRKQGLKFGVSNHSIEHYDFIKPRAGLKSDLDDPQYQDFYWTQHSDDRLKDFFQIWVKKNFELIDQYQIDMLWFDNGINSRAYDAAKLKVAAYYYNRAIAWKKQVAISTKQDAYLAGSILDFEKMIRGPKTILPGVWQVDEPASSTWGYTADMRTRPAKSVIDELIDVVSKNGNLLLNLSPKPDGTIPDEQAAMLRDVGAWLKTNGEAIYSTRAWKQFEEPGSKTSVRFTARDDALYVIALTWTDELTLPSLAKGKTDGEVTSVQLLGSDDKIAFAQTEEGLKIKTAGKPVSKYAWAFKISGIKLPPRGELKLARQAMMPPPAPRPGRNATSRPE